MTESAPFNSVNPNRNQGDEKQRDSLFDSSAYVNTEHEQYENLSEPKLSEYLENPFIYSTIQSQSQAPLPTKSENSNKEHNISYNSDNFNQIQDTFNDEYFYDDNESYPTLYSNIKFDQAAQPFSKSMSLYNSSNPFEKNKFDGRKTHNLRRAYAYNNNNSERNSHVSKKIINHYFLVNDNENEVQSERFTYTLSYMKHLKHWNMSHQSLLIPSKAKEHLESFSLIEKIYLDNDGNLIETKEEDDKETEEPLTNDYLINLSEKIKMEIKQSIVQNSIKADIRELLNAITIDNYTSIKDELIAIIKSSQGNQIKFIEVLFAKAIKEKLYSGIYAKLCKDIDRCLTNIKDKTKSPMREHLIDTCKKSFKNRPTNYPLADERQYIIGCVNLIGELINVQMISKKVSLQCIKTLLDKYAMTKEPCLIEASIVLLDKFGTIISRQSDKIRSTDLVFFIEKIDLRCSELNEMIKSKDASLQSHIVYKIINLLDKKSNGWKPTLYEQNQILAFNSEENSNGKYNSYHRDYSRNNNMSGNLSNSTIHNTKSDNNSYSMVHNTGTQGNLRKSEIINGPDIEYEEDQNPMKDNNKIYNIILKDIKDWIAFIQNGNNETKYQWKDIEGIYLNGVVYMDQIVSIYIDAALEQFPSLKTRKSKNALHDYFRVLIEYYYSKLSQKEIDGIVNVVVKNIKSFCYMKSKMKSYANYKEILEFALYYLIKYHVIQMQDFNALCKEKASIVEIAIDLIINIIYSVLDTSSAMMNEFKEIKLYKENVEFVNSLLQRIV